MNPFWMNPQQALNKSNAFKINKLNVAQFVASFNYSVC